MSCCCPFYEEARSAGIPDGDDFGDASHLLDAQPRRRPSTDGSASGAAAFLCSKPRLIKQILRSRIGVQAARVQIRSYPIEVRQRNRPGKRAPEFNAGFSCAGAGRFKPEKMLEREQHGISNARLIDPGFTPVESALIAHDQLIRPSR